MENRTLSGTRPPRLWNRLWIKLAVFGIFGVVLTHSLHLVVANRTTSAALVLGLQQEGRALAQIVARQGANALLLGDRVTLHELVAAAAGSGDVGYCFIQRGDQVVASSFDTGMPRALLSLVHHEEPIVVRNGNVRYLDIAQPMLTGGRATVRIGMNLHVLGPPRRQLSISLGTLALGVIISGILAAFIVGRRIARPVDKMVTALQSLDPAKRPEPLVESAPDEFGLLTRQVNEMRDRLYQAHQQQERARQEQMQTEKLASLGTLVAGVAHEVNNPLAGLKSCLEHLKRQDLPAGRREEYLQIMGEALDRIQGVVRQLLNFARIRPPRSTPQRMDELMARASGLVKPMLGASHITLLAEPGDHADTVVEVDKGQLDQALLNLLLNGIHVTPRGGELRLVACRRGDLVGLQVLDRGPGIPMALRDKVVDPFFTTKPEGQGTGLGLSVTRGIAEAHGGELTFDFPLDGGTAATIWLPVSESGE